MGGGSVVKGQRYEVGVAAQDRTQWGGTGVGVVAQDRAQDMWWQRICHRGGF